MSPRLDLARRVIVQCSSWDSYVELETVNISRDAFLVRLDRVPPAVGEQVRVWVSLPEDEGRRWTTGEVVRLHPEPSQPGDPGIVIQLTEPEAEAMDCLILKGLAACPRPEDVEHTGMAPGDGAEVFAVSMPDSVEIDLDAPAEDAPGSGPDEAAVDRDAKPRAEPKPAAYVPPPPSAIVQVNRDTDDRRRTGTAGPAPGRPDETPSGKGRAWSKRATGIYIMRPDQIVDDVGSAFGLVATLTPVEIPTSAVEGLMTHIPSPVPSGLVAHDTVVTEAVPEPLDEETDRVDDGGDTLVGPLPDESPPGREAHGAGELDETRLGSDRTAVLGAPHVPIEPSIVDVGWLIASPVEVSRRVGAAEPERTEDQVEPAEEELALDAPFPDEDTHVTEGPTGPAADIRGVRQISARPGWTGTEVPAVIGRAEGPVVGIDFGTTYSKVAVCAGTEVILIEDPSASSASRVSVPSIVGWTGKGKYVVGEHARELLTTSPAKVISSVKRVMGLKRSDPLANGLLGSLACPTKAGPNDTILFDVAGQHYTVPEVISLLLGHLRRMATRFAGAEVRRAVLTYPVDFDQKAKRELELAARMAGIEVVGMVAEPVAAAMGCGYDGSGHSTLVVYDFGGGTFDVSVVDVGQDRFEVKAAAGDRWLGGDDFDEIVARHVADEFQAAKGISLQTKVEAWQRLLFVCEEAKRWLTNLDGVDVVLPNAALTQDGPQTLLVPLTRTTFNDLASDIIASSLEICLQAARHAGIDPKQVDALIATGGTTRIPAVLQAAEHFFGKTAVEGIHPQHAVVIGAAVRAAVLSGTQVPRDFADRLRGHGASGRSIGLALAGGTTEHIIRGTERLPTVSHRLYSTQHDDQTTIRLELVEGTSDRTADNRRIGGFVITDLPSRKAGQITLDVYFELTSTGTLFVTAQERSTGLRALGTFEINEPTS
jgi:molecular chaperone DnaK